MLSLLGRVNREFGVTIVLVTHQMNVVQQVANRVAVMGSGRVVERGDVYNVFAAPQQAVTKRFIATVSGSAIGSITYEFSGDDALVRDFLGELSRSSDVIDFGMAADPIGYEDAIAAAGLDAVAVVPQPSAADKEETR